MTNLASEYAEYYQIDPQAEGEDAATFRTRVSDVLRDKGLIIEAHEAYQDARYESSEDVMDGIIGALSQGLSGTKYSGNRVGNDICSGLYVKLHKEEPPLSPEMAVLMVKLFG